MDNDFHSHAIKLAKYEDLRPAAYGVLVKKKKTELPKDLKLVICGKKMTLRNPKNAMKTNV